MINYKKYLYAFSALVLIIILWELFIKFFSVPEYLLPAPSKIFVEFEKNYQILLTHINVTFFESLMGFLLGSSFGILLAILFVYSKTLEMSLYPYAIALKNVPIVALAPLLIVWFGNGIFPKIVVAAIISFFPIVVNMVEGLKSADNESFDIFKSLSASEKQIFFKLRFPSSLPFLFAGLKLSATLAVVGAIVAEFAGSDKGLGFYILISSHRLETASMFLGIIASSLLGIFFFYLISFLEIILIPWKKNIK